MLAHLKESHPHALVQLTRASLVLDQLINRTAEDDRKDHADATALDGYSDDPQMRI